VRVYHSTTSERTSNKSIHIVVIWVDTVGSDKWWHQFGRPHCLQLQTRSPKRRYLPHRLHSVNLRENIVSLHRRGISNVNNSTSTGIWLQHCTWNEFFRIRETHTQGLTHKTFITERFLWLPSDLRKISNQELEPGQGHFLLHNYLHISPSFGATEKASVNKSTTNPIVEKQWF